MATLEQTEKILIEEFGKCCDYCKYYKPIKGLCKFDDEPKRGTDGTQCFGFEFDDFALKELKQEHLLTTQFGMIENPWKAWIMKEVR